MVHVVLVGCGDTQQPVSVAAAAATTTGTLTISALIIIEYNLGTESELGAFPHGVTAVMLGLPEFI